MSRPEYTPGGAPFGDWSQEVERLLEGLIGRAVGSVLRSPGGKYIPLCDIEETGQDFIARFDLPGVNPNDVRVEVHEGKLLVAGERKTFDESRRESFHRIERPFGQFYRLVQIPGEVDIDKIDAQYHNGVLEITMPKTERGKAHKVQIRTPGQTNQP